MDTIINKYVEIEARKRAERIDTAFKLVMAPWEWKLMMLTKSRLLGKILGYELRTYVNSNKFEIWKRGKKIYYTNH